MRFVALLACGFAFASPAHAQDAPRRNIIIIVADDMGYADVGFNGCKDIPTPNIDKLAQSGTRCSNGYVSGPYCSPTRAGLLTGRYQTRFGHEFNPGGGGEQGLPLSEVTLAKRLKDFGYRTGLVGKWHLGGNAKMHPMERGFDEFFGFLGGAHTYFPDTQATAIMKGREPHVEKEYLTDALAREAVSFMDRHKNRFFLYLAFNAVHTPMEAGKKYLDRFPNIKDKTRRTYAAMLSAMDDAIGRVMDKVRELKQEHNTIIFFISDNGGPTMIGTTINGSRNFPFRGSKRTTLEGGIHVPFLVVHKGVVPEGKVYEHPVIQLDIFPTALAAAGYYGLPTGNPDGVDLLPYLTGRKVGQPHDKLYWRFGEQMAIRSGEWSLVRYDLAVYAKEKGNKGVSRPKLYNLVKDIGQTTDVAADHPNIVRELQTAWDAWNSQNVPPIWGGKGKKKKGAED